MQPIPRVAGVSDSNKNAFPLLRTNLKVEIFNSISTISYSQIYTNTLTAPLECVYQFPLDKSYAVSNVEILIGDRFIQTKILEKEEAKQKYEDSVASGNTAALVKYDEEVADVLTLNLGSI